MADSAIPVLLNEGLDTVSPALLTKPGSLIDCLNYEMTGLAGYRRIDGFESYDGWINGDIVDYYKVEVQIFDVAVVPLLTPGTSITTAPPTGTPVVVGTVLDYTAPILTYAPANKDAPVIPIGTVLDVEFNTPGRMLSLASATAGSITDPAADFVDNVREYSADLRAMVQDHGSNIAGLHWFRQNLLLALDAIIMVYNDTTTASAVQEGYTISYNGIVYRVVKRTYVNPVMTLHLEPVGTNTPVPTIVVQGRNTPIATVTGAAVITVTNAQSDWAYLVYDHTPETNTERGSTTLKRTWFASFSNGAQVAGQDPQEGDLLRVTDGGNPFYLLVKTIRLESGTFAAGTAAGKIELIPDYVNSTANRNYLVNGDLLLDFGGVNTFMTLSNVEVSKIAGTKRLRAANTRYQWGSYNFYGQQDTMEAYGATGASRAFWATAYTPPLTLPPPPGATSVDEVGTFSWGNIYTQAAEGLDQPKYLSFHAGVQLALGFSGGSVLLSVGGQPRNYLGVEGALEITTGDALTGLLAANDDSTIVFGRRTIRRITGTTDTTLALKSISGNSGCFDYTAVLLGATAMFTGPAGISTLDQTAAYGDFIGTRVSYAVSTTLNPRLIVDYSDSEFGGAIMALPVRNKDQYRLWLGNGQMISVTITNEGPKIMYSNYGLSNEVRVPFAWTSQTADSGKEHVFVAWDVERARSNLAVTGLTSNLPDQKICYELERGWGFDGKTFNHYFDIAHLFQNSGTNFSGIEEIRMHGRGYGLATLNIKSAGIEQDYDQAFHTAIQDISMPRNLETFRPELHPFTSIVDQANWGLGVKLRICNTIAENLTTTEPSHTSQVLVLQLRTEGAKDN